MKYDQLPQRTILHTVCHVLANTALIITLAFRQCGSTALC